LPLQRGKPLRYRAADRRGLRAREGAARCSARAWRFSAEAPNADSNNARRLLNAADRCAALHAEALAEHLELHHAREDRARLPAAVEALESRQHTHRPE
jgi:hypothetical protein